MKGLDLKEKLLSETFLNKDFRIDSQFYTHEPYHNPKLKYDKIGNLIHKAQYGISIAMNEENEGYPIYRMNEIHNMLCDSNVAKFANITKEELETFTLNDRDVVFNRTNSFEWVGRTGLYKKKDEDNYVFASYLVRFIPNEEYLLPEYLTTFLNSKYGVIDIKRRARQSINQTNVNPEEVKAIDIPLFSMNFQNKLKSSFDSAHSSLLKSENIYIKAEKLLHKEIGLEHFIPSSARINVKTIFNSFGKTGRLDSEYYQPKYEEYEALIKKSKFSYIRDEYIHITKKSKKEEPGYNYIEIGDVNVGDGSNKSNYRLTDDLPANAKILVNKGDILISKVRPNRGAVTIINSELDDLIVSGAFTVLRSNPKSIYNNEVLKVLLRTELYKDWLLRFNVGTSYPVIKDDDVLNMPIPHIHESKQAEIGKLIEENYALKKQSENKLKVAKKAVEIAIEENEQSASNYINQNT